MRILILANNDVGLYKFRKELIQALLYKGHKVYISLPDGEMIKKLIDIGCVFIDTFIDRRGMNIFKDLFLLLKYKKIFKTVIPDLVISYTIKPNIYGGIVCRLLKIKYIENITGLGSVLQNKGILQLAIKFLYKVSCKKARVVFFENRENSRFFLSNGLAKAHQICCLNGAGVNLDEYPFSQYRDKNNKTIDFLFIGRIMKEKGIDELFLVAKKIKQEYKNINFHIVGPFEEEYKQEVNQLVKEKVIIYHGFQLDVRPFIEKCSCFVLPSYHEGMANTLLEAASMGRPIITSDIHGCKEAVLDNESGYLCKVKSAKSLYSKVLRFIELQYDKKLLMGIKARKHMEKHFNKDKIVEITLSKVEYATG